ncbi:Carbon monoxide dehydrogenase subunit G [Klenkia soli]|uniref:Carbon monoxide dehydrogenase subunit G n=1 Tax=Klenkia soli TaxID=1052260 RepID=A0A1H0GHZ3_9ACTN|nr:SRPBCC family protein [Klenkia soli]SDO06478.1 Carbon monoxide dehydrogenase subunit G [Klenkia soli]
MPDTYTVTREVLVAAPPAAVHELLVDFRRWREWSPFEDLDPGMQRRYEGSDVGSTYAWSGSTKAGTGRMELVVADPDRVVVHQQNHKPFRTTSTTTFTLVPVDGATRVTWSGSGTQTGLLRLVGRVVPMEKVLGPVFEKGLARLRERAEGRRS